jgi:hypothetical protein
VVASSLSISLAWDETREIFRRDGGLLVSVALALIVLPEVIVGIISPPEASVSADTPAGMQLLRFAVALISLIGQLALIRLALRPSTTVGAAIGHGARRFLSALGAVVLLIIGLGVVAVPVIIILSLALGVDIQHLSGPPSGPVAMMFAIIGIAALLISVRFTLVSPVASAETVGPVNIIKRSWHLTAGHYWRLLGFIGLLLVATIVLMIAAGVVGGLLARMFSPEIEPMSIGALILSSFAGAAQGAFSILASVMLARVYAQVAGQSENIEEALR